MTKIKLEFKSLILGKATELLVYIPEKMVEIQDKDLGVKREKNKAPYGNKPVLPVVYLLHGKSGQGASFYHHTQVERFSEDYGIITIAPSVEDSYYTNMVNGHRYFDYLAQEVPQRIKETFKFTMEKENTYVLGYSMGGYGAMKLGLTFPERFKGIASLSGSLRSVEENRELMRKNHREDLKLCYGEEESIEDPKNDLYQLVEKALKEGKDIPKIYLYCGEKDNLMTYNLRFKEVLEKNNIPHTFVKDEGNHEFTYWNRQIQSFFKMISGEEV